MKKTIIYILIGLLSFACKSLGDSGVSQKFSYETGLTPEESSEYALIVIQRELVIKYLDDKQTTFFSNNIYVKPGLRKITFVHVNSYEFTEYINIRRRLKPGRTYLLTFQQNIDGKIYFRFVEKKEDAAGSLEREQRRNKKSPPLI